MSEELEVQPVSPEIVDIPVELDAPVETISEPIRISKYEEAALAKGWKPKDNFVGDPEEFRSAKDWLERGELLDTIHSLNRKVQEQKEAVDHLAEFNKKIEVITREKLLSELESKHRAAVEVGDVDAAAAVAKDMVKAHSDLPMFKEPAVAAPIIPEEVQSFVNRNASWFNDSTAENAAMKAFALRRDAEIAAANPGIAAKDAMALVESDVKKIFAHKFASAPTSAVAAPSAAPVKPKEVTVNGLPEFHQMMVKKLQRSTKSFDVKAYIENLRKAGEIK